MKPTLLLMAGAAVLVLAACDGDGRPAFGPPKMKAVAKLNCPDDSGDLRRVSAAADGKSCAYVDQDGSEVTLQLVPVAGDAEAALKPIEASLAGLVPSLDAKPQAVATDAAPSPDAPKAAKDAAAAGATAASDAAVDAAAAADDQAGDAGDAGDTDTMDEEEDVDVDMPGIHVRTRGDKAEVKVFGFHIDADESGGNDQVRVRHGKGLVIDANDNGAVVRMTNASRKNLKTTVIYKMDDAGPQGHRVVGYVARGPRTGPLVVATIKSKHDTDDIGPHDGVFSDATRLVRRASRGR